MHHLQLNYDNEINKNRILLKPKTTNQHNQPPTLRKESINETSTPSPTRPHISTSKTEAHTNQSPTSSITTAPN